MQKKKVAIIGAGAVGASCAQRIVEADLADVVILDIVQGRPEAVALDLNSASSIMRHTSSVIGTNNYADIAGSDIVIITAGLTRRPGQGRDDLLSQNAKIVQGIAEKIPQYCTDCIVIVVSNPVDVMTYLVYRCLNFPAHQIIGMGGTSDCARFNMLAAKELDTASDHVHSLIIGAHGDSMVVLPRLSTVLGAPLTDFLAPDRIAKIIEETRGLGTRIVQLLGAGSAYFGPSAGVFLLVDAIINSRKAILCASVYLAGQYGLKDLCLGVPVKISRKGAEEIIELKLTRDEKNDFLASAESVKSLIKKLGA